MPLYAIGDLHLHFQSEVKSPAQAAEKIWVGHEKIFKKNCEACLTPEDTLVLAGDHTWGGKLDHCRLDLEYIADLPGRKILLRGNHDFFWDVKKTEKLNEMYKGRLYFLQGNFYSYGEYALVGTKGFCYEGRGSMEHAQMLVEREAARLQTSFDLAKAAGYRKFIVFLHYPPTSAWENNSIFTKMAEREGAEQVVYGHCHGQSHFHDSIRGKKRGIRYSLVSGDCLHWHPQKIL